MTSCPGPSKTLPWMHVQYLDLFDLKGLNYMNLVAHFPVCKNADAKFHLFDSQPNKDTIGLAATNYMPKPEMDKADKIWDLLNRRHWSNKSS